MNKYGRNLILRLIQSIDAVAIVTLFGICWFAYYADQVYVPFFFWGNWFVIGLYLFVFLALGKIYDAFAISPIRISEMVYGQGLTLIILDAIFFLISCLLARKLVSPAAILLTLLCQTAVVILWSYGSHRLYCALFPPKRSAVVYDYRKDLDKVITQYDKNKKFHIQATFTAEECLRDLTCLDGLEVVFFSGVHSRDRNAILKYCVSQGILCYVIPRIGDVIMSGAKQSHLFHLTFFQVGHYSPALSYLAAKRIFDILFSAAALIVLSPIFLITAIAIKICDGGPVFYRQNRLTKGGRVFVMHKFRSMRTDAEKDGIARLSTGNHDTRVTPVGRVIRKLRIDELPQLLDILAGNLSIVGPRPERPEIFAQYEQEIPEFRLRLQAKAGLTGYAQVYGQYNSTPYDKLQMDLLYLSNPSLLEDLRICFATAKILFMPESTVGIAEGSTTAVNKPEADNRNG